MKDARSDRCSACRKAAFVAECHPNRPHFARGQCERCYSNDYQRGDRARGYRLKHLFGITLERYNAMLAAQHSACAICGTTNPGGTGTFHVDHNHACCPGKRSCGECIRGLLCLQCNHLLGNCQDDPDVLRRAAGYLQRRAPADRAGHINGAPTNRAHLDGAGMPGLGTGTATGTSRPPPTPTPPVGDQQ
jgi:hypothetical protein